MSEFIHLKNIQWTAQWVTTRKKTQFSADWWPHSYQWCHHSCSSFSSSYMSWHPRVGWWGLRCMWFTANVFRKHCYALKKEEITFILEQKKRTSGFVLCFSEIWRSSGGRGWMRGWGGGRKTTKRTRLAACLLAWPADWSGRTPAAFVRAGSRSHRAGRCALRR